ncbi:MAG: diacylglycerol kinase [Alphaproteobacteria bacterium]|nr:MAG: diacylglycerol kinase [Alphaproteobacteria bacterium]
MKNQSFLRRLDNAWQGIHTSWLSEKSFRFHCAATLLVIVILGLIRPAPIWWALLLLVCGLVLTLELVNTAIEKLIDLLHPEQHPVLKIVKDTLAGAVLVASLIATGIFIAFVFTVISG